MNEPTITDDVRRGMKAVMDAPATPSGIIVPPHVLQEQKQEAATRPLNRAERRRKEKWERSAAGRRHAAQTTPEVEDAVEATLELTDKQQEIALAYLDSLTKMTPLEREQALEDFEREHGGDVL